MISVVVGASFGALSAPEIAREISSAGYEVEVVLSDEARFFVGPAAFAGIGNVVESPSGGRPEALVFAPAEAGTIARLARGLHDFGDSPVFVAPDLDFETSKHPAVKENIRVLRGDGAEVVEGDEKAAMASAREVCGAVLGGLGGPMSGLRVLVTAGGTRERIDSVRFIGNRSSGRMGLALARRASRLGAEVTLVGANVGEREPGVLWVSVESVEEMKTEVMERIGSSDVLVMAAAVSDFTPDSPVQEKIRRANRDRVSLELTSTPDILGAVRSQNEDVFVIGFAATHGDPVPDAREKLLKKGADLIVGNDISQAGIGFDSRENEVCVVGRDGVQFIPRASKDEVARAILDASLMEMGNLDKEKR